MCLGILVTYLQKLQNSVDIQPKLNVLLAFIWGHKKVLHRFSLRYVSFLIYLQQLWRAVLTSKFSQDIYCKNIIEDSLRRLSLIKLLHSWSKYHEVDCWNRYIMDQWWKPCPISCQSSILFSNYHFSVMNLSEFQRAYDE